MIINEDYLENIDTPEYLHGNCQDWVIDNYQEGDTVVVIREYDYDIDETCMVHSLLKRDGKFLDVRGYMDDMDEVLEEFDCDDSDVLELDNLKEFKEYLDNMEIPYQKHSRTVNESIEENGVVVYRGMDKDNNTSKNIWVTDSEEYALYWAEKEYNANGIVKKYFISNNVIQDLCNQDMFEEIMNDYDAWQEIPEDSNIWDEIDSEDAEYDLMHDLCFPSKQQISILKKEGYKGYLFNYTDDCYSILIFDRKDLIAE